MGARVGLHSSRARRTSTPLVAPISSSGWRTETVCPSCGVTAEDFELGVKFRCPDERCAFHHGWRLDLTSTTEPIPVMETYNDGDGHNLRRHTFRDSRKMIAIPLDAAGDLRSVSLAVRWPRDTTSSEIAC
jgi:predicted RNA-binding Zn-ribbon protein involved in translation (DUF1610 family)